MRLSIRLLGPYRDNRQPPSGRGRSTCIGRARLRGASAECWGSADEASNLGRASPCMAAVASSPMRTARLRVTMRDVEPAVVRVLDVPAGVVLPELHDLLQAALGWTDSHLHQFVADSICYGMPDVDGPEDERDESAVPLRALPHRFLYLYDFGDSWEHEVAVV